VRKKGSSKKKCWICCDQNKGKGSMWGEVRRNKSLENRKGPRKGPLIFLHWTFEKKQKRKRVLSSAKLRIKKTGEEESDLRSAAFLVM